MCTLGTFDVIVLDEPFNGLDADGRDRLTAEIRELTVDRTVVLSAHALPDGIAVDQTVVLGSPADN
jgi:ABC-2 type transport system ATP-binding protein